MKRRREGPATARARRSGCARISFMRHSQTTITRQPRRRSSLRERSSRATLRANFASQNSRCASGVVAREQPLCRCQKHPFTKITVPYFRSTMSGVPGNDLSHSRNRNPSPYSNDRIRFSGPVSLLRTRDMLRVRASAEIRSIFKKTKQAYSHAVFHAAHNLSVNLYSAWKNP